MRFINKGTEQSQTKIQSFMAQLDHENQGDAGTMYLVFPLD